MSYRRGNCDLCYKVMPQSDGLWHDLAIFFKIRSLVWCTSSIINGVVRSKKVEIDALMTPTRLDEQVGEK